MLAPAQAIGFNTWRGGRHHARGAGSGLLLRIIVIGRCKDKHLGALADGYAARIRPLAPVEVVELKDRDPAREARDMVQKLGSPDGRQLVIALDEHGDDLTSAQFAEVLLGAQGGILFWSAAPTAWGPLRAGAPTARCACRASPSPTRWRGSSCWNSLPWAEHSARHTLPPRVMRNRRDGGGVRHVFPGNPPDLGL